jgi:hypothetical protein
MRGIVHLCIEDLPHQVSFYPMYSVATLAHPLIPVDRELETFRESLVTIGVALSQLNSEMWRLCSRDEVVRSVCLVGIARNSVMFWKEFHFNDKSPHGKEGLLVRSVNAEQCFGFKV